MTLSIHYFSLFNAMNFLMLPLLLSVPALADEQPVPKVPVGRETTFVTEPIDKDGTIDYEAALNERLRKTTTPKTNACVLLWKATGPEPGGNALPREFFAELGIGVLPIQGDYFVGLAKYLMENLKMPPDEAQPVVEQRGRAIKRPWTFRDCPHLGAWLIHNDKALALVVEATKRPHYFHPIISPRGPDGKQGRLVRAPSAGVQQIRVAGAALTTRAMLRLGEGKEDDAWQDLLAAHQLARLLTSGSTLQESLAGFSLDSMACQADLAYLQGAKLSTRQYCDRLKQLQELAPLVAIAEKIDLFERFEYLDCLQAIRRGDLDVLRTLDLVAVPKEFHPRTQERLLQRIDWAPFYREGNKWFDRAVSGLKAKDRAEREKQLDRLDADLIALNVDAESVQRMLQKLTVAGAEPDRQMAKAIHDMLIKEFMAVRRLQSVNERSEQMQCNVRIAFALAAYRSAKGSYPAKLDALKPTYLASVPLDVFSGKPLVYRPSEKGYLFYSVGPNGKDDNGRWYDDEPSGDDPGVRMPLPELKR